MLPASILIAALLISVSLMYNAGKQPDQSGGKTKEPSDSAGIVPQKNADWSFVTTDPAIGPADAKVTVVEFSDFQCPYCGIVYGRNLGGTQYDAIRGTATKVVNDYAKTGKVRFVYHIMAFLGQESIDAANAALCAREIGGDEAFFKMHDAIFNNQKNENQGDFSKTNLKRIASDAGFKTTGIAGCIDSGKFNTQVTDSSARANAVGVEGTPTFAINNQVNAGAVAYTTMKQALDALLQK